jgi:uncharacterized protein YjbI with pentapeptide repeats
MKQIYNLKKFMEETLKILVDRYKKGLLTTPNIQLINMRFSDEMLIFPDTMDDNFCMDVCFSWCLMKKSDLTSIKICNGNFESGFFTESTLENCIFENTNFQELKCEKCVFKNCSFIDCTFVDSHISETIFSNCKFEKGSLGNCEFYSCEFINPIFSDVGLAFTIIGDSKFAKFNKSIKFEGKFFLIDILEPKNGILGIFQKDWY